MALNLIADLVHSSVLVGNLFLKSENHLKALWSLVQKFQNDPVLLEKTYALIEFLTSLIDDGAVFSYKFIKFIRDLLHK
jgi:hypothetical protein